MTPPSCSRANTPAPSSPAATGCSKRSATGGMGTVWMAEQTQPVRRECRREAHQGGHGLGSVLARFEAERQALAMMDHPNIAKVLDGGTTEERPALLRHGIRRGRPASPTIATTPG